MTPMPQPKVMTIQPEFWALEWFSSTAATTPSPNRIRSAVPIVSAPMMLKRTPLLEQTKNGDPGATLERPYSGRSAQVNGARVHRRVAGGADVPVARRSRG